MLLHVIPDIHGRLDALEAFLEATRLFGPRGGWQGRPQERLVQLGDLIDRGPRSRACVERMKGLCERFPGRVFVLRGNHEQLALDAPRDEKAAWMWRLNGGLHTKEDYGPDFDRLLGPGGLHARWFDSLPFALDFDGVLLCHAGLGEGNEAAKDPQGLLWHRGPWVLGPWKAVICGHTPTESGRIEEQDRVFRCDIGLAGMGAMTLEYLQFETNTLERWVVKAGEVGKAW